MKFPFQTFTLKVYIYTDLCFTPCVHTIEFGYTSISFLSRFVYILYCICFFVFRIIEYKVFNYTGRVVFVDVDEHISI